MTDTTPSRPSFRFDARWFTEVLALAALYFLTARLGLLLAMPGGYVTPVWPPSGIALAAVLLRGRRIWPGVWLGSFANNMWSFTGGPEGMVTSLAAGAVIGTGGACTALCGAWMIRRITGMANPLDRVRDVCVFLALGGVVNSVLAATIGVTTLCVAEFEPWSAYGQTWLTWWLGDAAGVFVFAPLALVWFGARSRRPAGRNLELCACFGLLIAVTGLVFFQGGSPQLSGKPLAFLITPFLIWPAIRFGQRGATSAAGIISLLAVWGTVRGLGPFNILPRAEALLLLELFLSLVVVTVLCMGAAATERARAEEARERAMADLEARVQERTAALMESEGLVREHLAQAERGRVALLSILEDVRASDAALRKSQEHLTSLINSVDGIVWEADAETFQFTYVSPQAERLLGYPVSQWMSERAFWAEHIHADDREYAVNYCASCTREKKDHDFDYRMVAADGREVWLRDIVSVTVENDRAVKLRGIMVDITASKNAELRIQRLNRTYIVLSEINQLIVRERDPQVVLETACRIAVENGGFKLAWIGMAPGPGGQLRVAAHSGASAEAMEAVIPGGLPGNGCAFTERAFKEGACGTCNDIEHDGQAGSWRDAAMSFGYLSMTSLPLKLGGLTIGTFNLYAGERDFFDDEEMRLLDELGADISFALEVSKREVERRVAEDALRASDERFRELAAHIAEVFWITDPAKSRILYVSPAFETLWGSSCESLRATPRAWADAIHPDDRERVLHAAATRQVDGLYDEEFRIVRPDGSVRWIRDRAFPVKVESGDVVRIVGVARDVTALHEAGAELQRREEYFRSLIEHASDVITVITAEGIIRFQSPSAERILGYRPDELVSASVFELIHPEDTERATEAMQRALLNPAEPTAFEYRVKVRDGSWRTLQSIGRPLHAADEGGLIVVNSRDITAGKLLEEQFRQAQKMEAIGQLAGGVAHDFNNILAAIMMQAELASLTEGLPAESGALLGEIKASAERAANLTRQLLAFSRRQVMQPRMLDLNDVVASLGKMVRRIVGEDVQFHLDLHPRPIPVTADAGMLDQVLMNLVVNARDAMPDGGRLTVETSEVELTAAEARAIPEARPGRHASVSVCDTGCGILAEDLPRIFEPFFTTKGVGKGTGLGLATVFGVVKQHEGAIKVESEPGRGTKFTVYLPSAADEAKPAARQTMRSIAPGGSETILVVEDEPGVRNLTRVILERHGYKVLEAVHGVDALRVWAECGCSIDLLLTDIVMPEGVNGYDLAKLLLERDPKVRVIFTSGYSADIAGRELTLLEGQNFIQKPCMPIRLLETVRRCLDS